MLKDAGSRTAIWGRRNFFERAEKLSTCASDIDRDFIDKTFFRLPVTETTSNLKKVDDRERPIEKQFEAFRAEHLYIDNPKHERYRIIEHLLTLKDYLWSDSVKPNKISFFNIYAHSLRPKISVFADGDETIFSCIFDLDMEIRVETRTA